MSPMTDLAGHMTRGEALTLALLEAFPRQAYFYAYEPRLISDDAHGAASSKPDFVIVSARHGVIVLEIKDWGRIVSGTQKQIDTIRADGARASYDNPYNTAERYAYDLKKRFETRVELWEQYRGRTQLKFPWQVMVGLPHIAQSVIAAFEDKGIWTPRTVAGREAFASPAALRAFIENLPYKFQIERALTPDMLDIIREILDPSLAIHADGQLVGTLTREQDRLIRERLTRFDPKQLPLLPPDDDDLSSETVGIIENHEVRLVRGVAGSGKTLVLVRRAQYLAAQYPDARILVLTFNKRLTADLERRIGRDLAGVMLTNFHKLCAHILKDGWQSPLVTADWLTKYAASELTALGMPVAFLASELEWRRENGLTTDDAYLNANRDGRGYRLDTKKRAIINGIFARYEQYKRGREKESTDWADVPFLALDRLDTHPQRHSYDVILIDEGQDFAPSWMRVVKALLKPDGQLFICDDPTQSIVRDYTWRAKGVPVSGRTIHLRVPFRSTRRISEAAHSLIEADPILSASGDRIEPNFTSYELHSGVLPSLIACADAAAERAFIDAKLGDLQSAGVPLDQIAILCYSKRGVYGWAAWGEQGVHITSFDVMKGLEFAAVFIPHLEDAFEPDADAERIAAMRRKLFTAMTRARSRLYLSYSGTLPDALAPLLDYVANESYPAP